MDPSGHRQSSKTVIDFFNDPLVQSFFTSPSSAFEPPSDKSPYHATFEKKTAAIHVTPTPNDKYDIHIIKEDALWLSRNAHINEVAALRVVVVEYQTRPTSQLLGPISNQDVANLRAAAGAGNTQTSNIIPGLNLTATLDASEIQAEFDKHESRKQRIFQTYLSERRYYAATNDYVFTLMLQEKLPMSPATDASRSIRESLLEVYGMSSKQSQKSTAEIPIKTCHALIAQYISLIPECVQRAAASLESVVEDKGLVIEDMQELWMQTSLTEMLHRMSILFQLLDRSSDCFVSDNIAKDWFSLVNDLSFLNQLQGVCTFWTGIIWGYCVANTLS
jgi:nuclear pore complex protein Nup188